MKVNVKGLVFVGFAAAILAGAAKADDTNIVTSKAFTDATYQAKTTANNSGKVLKMASNTAGDIGYQDVTSTYDSTNGLTANSGNLITEGVVKAAIAAVESGASTSYEVKTNKLTGGSGSTIGGTAAGSAAGQDQTMYPSAAAVKEYVTDVLADNGTAGSGYQHTSTADFQVGGENGTWKTVTNGTYTTAGSDGNGGFKVDVNAATGFTNVGGSTSETQVDNSKLPTALAVKTYVDSQAATAAGDILENTTLSANVSDKAPTVGLMYSQQALDEKVANKTTSMANTDTSATTYPTTGAVVNYAQEKVGGGNNAGKLVTATSTAGNVNYTAVESTGSNIATNGTDIPTTGAVADYVASQITSATGGNTIPQKNTSVCTASYPCALVAEGDYLNWRVMAVGGNQPADSTQGNSYPGACGNVGGTCPTGTANS